jgi:hypothetical protein
MRPRGWLALALLAYAMHALAQSPAELSQIIRFQGEVTRGTSFERALGRDLVFRLRAETHPSNPAGWTISVAKASDAIPERDFLSVATPPYRFFNPRDLTVSYGYTAEQIVGMTPREFLFVLNDSDHERMSEALGKLLWSYNHSEQELEIARKVMDETPAGAGRLHILDSRLGGQERDRRDWIEWLRFRVELRLPCDFPAAPGLEADRTACAPNKPA